MSDLIVVGFDTPDEADKVLVKLAGLKKEYLIDLEDAVVGHASSNLIEWRVLGDTELLAQSLRIQRQT